MRLFELFGVVGRSARAELMTARDLEAITSARRAYSSSDFLSKYRDNPNLMTTRKPNAALEDDFSVMNRLYDDDTLRSIKLLDEELAAKQGSTTAKDSKATTEADNSRNALQTETSKLRFIILDSAIASGATYCGLTKCYGDALRAALANERRKRVEEREPTKKDVDDVFALK